MVFVLDKRGKPLMPCSEKRARLLLVRRRAVVHRRFPFTIRLKDRCVQDSHVQSFRLKLDPGSKITGWALLQDAKILALGELVHKPGIKHALDSRRALRQGRRSRKTRYRQPRFLNRVCRKKKGWLSPSLAARVQQTMHLVAKLRRSVPITALSTEHVKFDTQLLENPNISGIEYRQGTLAGYEIKEYLLERDGRQCAYCKRKDVPLEVEHIVPKSRGGSDRVSNLTLSCTPCNRKKGNRTAEEFGFPDVQEKTKRSLRDAGMLNATRWRLYEKLKETGLPVECGTGARTKYQRIKHGLPKEHYFDAACVGASTPERLTVLTAVVYRWCAKGRGTRRIVQSDAYGFPRQYRSRQKRHFGFGTGDLVRGSRKTGQTRVGRVTVGAKGGFYIVLPDKQRFNFSAKKATLLQRNDGWEYATKTASQSKPFRACLVGA